MVVGVGCGHCRAAVADVPRECAGPAWTQARDTAGERGRGRGVGSAACTASEPDPAERHAALTDAVRDLVVRSNLGDLLVLSFFSENRALAAASAIGEGALPPGLADRLAELVCRVRARLDTEYWYDPCLRRLWCAAGLASKEVGQVTAALLARNDLDGVLDDALKALAEQTGQKARRLVVYRIMDQGGVAEGPMDQGTKVEHGR